jgi:malonyl-CoA/methylmalonyl-CoA synthetase
MNNNIFQHFFDAPKNSADKFIETESGDILTYQQVFSLSGQIANALVAQGLMVDDRVAAQVEKSVAALALYLAVVRSGAIFLPLNTAYTDSEMAYFLGDAEPSILICDPSREGGLQHPTKFKTLTLSDNNTGTLLDDANQQSADFITVERSQNDLAAILYTSGTTGKSKGAMLTHNNLLSNAASLVEIWQFTTSDCLIHALPTYHTHGLFVATNTIMLAGASMIYLPKFDADKIMGLLPRATSLMGVPTFYTRLLAHPKLNAQITKNIRLFVSGSAPLLAETHIEWTEKTGHNILERYGMTETNMNSSNPYVGSRVPGSVGFALPNVDIRIDAAAGEIGVIEIKGPNIFKGYWRNPQKTAAEFRGDYFITGDLGKFDEHGYLYIVGRSKDLVITGGFNVYPIEVESEIDAVSGVLESAVIGLPHKDFGEAVTAVVVKKGAVTEAEIIKILGIKLAKFKQPKAIIFATDLPRNAMGKVQKNLLRETYKTYFA